MNATQIERAIDERLTGLAAAFWNGAARDVKDEFVIEAQRNGLDAAIHQIEAYAEE